jgi:phosphoenolpyruvate carboxylase
MKQAPAETPLRQTRDNERPLVEDIRLLGRILGDVIRQQEGAAAFELIEQIRKLSVAFRRDADHEADKALKKLLKSLSGEQAVSVIRAFTYFSHLANLAEDRHHIRRRAVHERAGHTQEGSIEVALQRMRWAGITPQTIAQTLARSYVAPVLTAHPTEVQRQSILSAERDIAHLLTARDEIKDRAAAVNAAKDALSPRELADRNAERFKNVGAAGRHRIGLANNRPRPPLRAADEHDAWLRRGRQIGRQAALHPAVARVGHRRLVFPLLRRGWTCWWPTTSRSPRPSPLTS